MRQHIKTIDAGSKAEDHGDAGGGALRAQPECSLAGQTSQTAALTVDELAAQIKYHPESVRRAIRQGRIHALQFGTGWRIPAPEVNRILTTGLPYRAEKGGGCK